MGRNSIDYCLRVVLDEDDLVEVDFPLPKHQDVGIFAFQRLFAHSRDSFAVFFAPDEEVLPLAPIIELGLALLHYIQGIVL